MFHKKINKNVNKQNIRNSENWFFDDVSEIKRNKQLINVVHQNSNFFMDFREHGTILQKTFGNLPPLSANNSLGS